MRRTSNCSFSPSPNKSVRNLFRTATTIPELLVVIGVVTGVVTMPDGVTTFEGDLKYNKLSLSKVK